MNQQPIAGWYEDPEDPTAQSLRYWDGQAWTDLPKDNVSGSESADVGGVETGRYGWALGFLAWIPIPFVGLLIAAVAMSFARRTPRRKGSALCTENTRGATNWGLTVLAVALVCVAYFIAILLGFPDVAQRGFFPLGAVVIVYFVLVVVHSVLTIAGTVVAGRGKVFNPRIAIPFVRASQLRAN